MVVAAAGRHPGTPIIGDSMKIRITLALAALALVGVACTTEPDTLGVKSFDGATTDETAPAASTPTTEAPAAVSTCDVAREALLTGSPTDINTAMLALKADTAADATAREYADYYTGRDKGDAQMQEMDAGLIRMSCSI